MPFAMPDEENWMQDPAFRFWPFILYIGPDVLMPVASAIAAVLGFLLMFWKRTVAVMKRMGQAIARFFGRLFGKR